MRIWQVDVLNKPGLILIGAGGHARACLDVIEHEGTYQVAGLVGSAQEVGTQCLGYDVRATDSELQVLALTNPYALIAVGQVTSPTLRIELYRKALDCGFEMPTIVSTSAYVSRHASLGAGTIVMHGAVVNAGASIGENCIINSCSLVEHDVFVGDSCHISTGAVINGGATVGDGSFVGSGAVLREGVEVGALCIVGMGCSVRKHLEDGARFVGGQSDA